MKLQFFTPAFGIPEGTFGGATFGFVGHEDERLPGSTTWPDDLRGIAVCGSYEECLAGLPERDWKAGIVLLGNAGGENDFIRRLHEKTRAPLTGGGGAIDPNTGAKGLITGRGEAAVLMLDDERFDFAVEYENIHRDVLGEHALGFSDPRVLDTIDGEDAAVWLRKAKAGLSLPPEDFEHLTFSDLGGVNAHLSFADGRIRSGRDLCPRMLLRYAAPERVQARMERFYRDESAIVFGCAGLKGILDKPLGTPGMGLFMFGEVCTGASGSAFGNLMLSKLRVLRREGA